MSTLKRNTAATIALAASGVLLAACGGGSSTAGTPAVIAPVPVAPTTYALNTLMTNLYSGTLSVTLTGTDTNTSPTSTITQQATFAPGSTATFEGLATKSMAQIFVGTQNDKASTPYVQSNLFTIAPFKLIGGIDNDGAYFVYANQVTLPDNAVIGDSGNFHTDTAYSDSSKKTVVQSDVTTWNLEAGPTASTAFFCTTQVSKSPGSTSTNSQKLCFQTDSSGRFGGSIKYTSTNTSNGVAKAVTLNNVPPSKSTFALNTLLNKQYSTAETFTLKATDTSVNPELSYVLAGTFTPGASSSFEGVTASSRTLTATQSVNGTSLGDFSQTDYFLPGTFKPLGMSEIGLTYNVYSDQSALADNVTIGSSGVFYTGKIYADSKKTAIQKLMVTTWALEPGTTAGTAAYCETQLSNDGKGGFPEVNRTCFQIDANSNALGKVTFLNVYSNNNVVKTLMFSN